MNRRSCEGAVSQLTVVSASKKQNRRQAGILNSSPVLAGPTMPSKAAGHCAASFSSPPANQPREAVTSSGGRGGPYLSSPRQFFAAFHAAHTLPPGSVWPRRWPGLLPASPRSQVPSPWQDTPPTGGGDRSAPRIGQFLEPTGNVDRNLSDPDTGRAMTGRMGTMAARHAPGRREGGTRRTDSRHRGHWRWKREITRGNGYCFSTWCRPLTSPKNLLRQFCAAEAAR